MQAPFSGLPFQIPGRALYTQHLILSPQWPIVQIRKSGSDGHPELRSRQQTSQYANSGNHQHGFPSPVIPSYPCQKSHPLHMTDYSLFFLSSECCLVTKTQHTSQHSDISPLYDTILEGQNWVMQPSLLISLRKVSSISQGLPSIWYSDVFPMCPELCQTLRRCSGELFCVFYRLCPHIKIKVF